MKDGTSIQYCFLRFVVLGKDQLAREHNAREIWRRARQENMWTTMKVLQQSVKVERAQREVLEERVRASEEEWFVHDKMMSDIKQQLHQCRQVCHDLKDSWQREVEKLRSMQQQQQQQTQQPQFQLQPHLLQYVKHELLHIKQEPF